MLECSRPPTTRTTPSTYILHQFNHPNLSPLYDSPPTASECSLSTGGYKSYLYPSGGSGGMGSSTVAPGLVERSS